MLEHRHKLKFYQLQRFRDSALNFAAKAQCSQEQDVRLKLAERYETETTQLLRDHPELRSTS